MNSYEILEVYRSKIFSGIESIFNAEEHEEKEKRPAFTGRCHLTIANDRLFTANSYWTGSRHSPWSC
jgi:hypothetical protein